VDGGKWNSEVIPIANRDEKLETGDLKLSKKAVVK
jgi:hypothetical protein